MRSFLSMVALSLFALPPAPASDSLEARAAITRLGGTFETAPTGAILKIDLHASGVTDADLAFLSGCPDLRSLDLRLTKISDAALAHVDGLHRLQFLNLFRTNVTDAGVASLARLGELETLLVGGTGVTDRGLAALKPLSKLRKLSVFDTRVTDAGLVPLEGLPALEVVLVAKTSVSEEGKRSLREANPKIRFEEASAIEAELFRIEGEAFVAPSRNNALQALLSKNPILTFFEACGVGDAAEVARRLEGDPVLATAWNDHGWTALHLAAFSGSAEAVRLLLDRGADPNLRARTKFRNTPLQTALLTGSHETAKLLLERGADPNVRQALGFTPLQEAALLGRRDLVDLLLAHGAELNSRADDGRTALTEALRGKHAEVAAYLRSRGAKGAEITANVLASPD